MNWNFSSSIPLNDLRFGLERFHDTETCSKPATYPRLAVLYRYFRSNDNLSITVNFFSEIRSNISVQ